MQKWKSIGIFNDESVLSEVRNYNWNEDQSGNVLPERRVWHLKSEVSFPPHKATRYYKQYGLTSKNQPHLEITDLIKLINDFVGLNHIFLSRSSDGKLIPVLRDDNECNIVLYQLNCIYIIENEIFTMKWKSKNSKCKIDKIE